MKLTKGIKDEIIKGVIHANYADMVKDYFEDHKKLVLEYVDIALRGVDINELRKHDRFVGFTNEVRVYSWSVNRCGKYSYKNYLIELFMTDYIDYTDSFEFDRDFPCSAGKNELVLELALCEKDYQVLQHARERLSTEFMCVIEEMQESKRELRSVLNSCTTDKQLLDVLPEIKKYIPNVEVKAVAVVSGDIVEKVKGLL